MLTAVIYQNGDCRLISTDHLNKLIGAGEIKQLLRLEGWTTLGLDPIRKKLGADHQGPERRQQFISFHDNELANIKLIL